VASVGTGAMPCVWQGRSNSRESAVKHRILVIEDDASARAALTMLLTGEDYDVVDAGNGVVALSLLDEFSPDLVITDLEMPWLGGFGFIRAMRERAPLKDVPVIVLSANDETPNRVASFGLGADDFLPKPVNVAELLARVSRHLNRLQQQREVKRQSVSDELTGMLNRRGVLKFLRREIDRPGQEQASHSVLMIDINKFKAINDRLGHAVGDIVLCAVARVLQDTVRASDRVGRFGGDEFLLALPGADANAVLELTDRLRRQMPLVLQITDTIRVEVTLAIGGATLHRNEALDIGISRADFAMYDDKRRAARARH